MGLGRRACCTLYPGCIQSIRAEPVTLEDQGLVAADLVLDVQVAFPAVPDQFLVSPALPGNPEKECQHP